MATIYDRPEGEIFEFKFENFEKKGRVEMRVVYSESEKRTNLWEFIFLMKTSFVNSWFVTYYDTWLKYPDVIVEYMVKKITNLIFKIGTI